MKPWWEDLVSESINKKDGDARVFVDLILNHVLDTIDEHLNKSEPDDIDPVWMGTRRGLRYSKELIKKLKSGAK